MKFAICISVLDNAPTVLYNIKTKKKIKEIK